MALTDNIVAYWKLNNNGSGGVSLVDSTGNGNTLINNGGVTLDPNGIIDQAAYINNLSGNALPSSTLITSSTPLTYAAWFQSSLGQTGAWGGVSTGYPNGFRTLAIDGDFSFQAPDQSIISTSGGTYNDANWHYVVGVADGSDIYLYVDGSLVASSSNSSTASSAYLDIGGELGQGYGSSNMDEIGVWSRALSPSEIYSLYNNGLGNTYPFVSLYFSGGNLSSLSNWWQDSLFTIPAASLPDSTTSVLITQNATSGSLVCFSATINNVSVSGSITGVCTFNGTSSNSGSITGVCTFNNTSSNSGSVAGNCTFNGSSSNTGSITGNAFVYYPAQNPLGGSVSGTISYFWPNGTGIWGGDVWVDGENVVIIPAENEVKAGVIYGFPATPLTGTYSGGGVGSSSISISRLLNLPSFIKI
jgi:hypothetical protein